MIGIIWNFIQAHPGIFLFIVLFAAAIILAVMEQIIYEHIPCHIWENGKRRGTSVLRHKRKNSYKFHGMDGKWKDLTPGQIQLLEGKRRKFDIHGKHIHPELHF